MDENPGITMSKMAVSAILTILALSAVVFVSMVLQLGYHKAAAGVLEKEAVTYEEADIRKYRQAYVSGRDVYNEVRNHLDDGLGIYICNTNKKALTMFTTQYCQCYGYLPTADSGGTADASNVKVSYVDGRFQVPDLAGEYNTDVSPTVDSGECSLTYIEQATEWYADIVYLGNSNNYAGIIFIQKY